VQKTTISKLNQLNQEFYQTTAQDFSDSRNYYWHGWYELIDILQTLKLQTVKSNKKIKVLDLGCGNARFAKFLKREARLHRIEYHGVDNNSRLLDLAQKQMTQIRIPNKLTKLDIVKSLVKNSLDQQLRNEYDLIVCFGILHHIPSFKLRKRLFKNLNSLLKDNAFLIITSWQFAKDERFEKKIIQPEQVDIKAKELESDDYILDWQRGTPAYRYCHYTSEEEMHLLAKGSKLQLLDSFKADGKSKQLNLYAILKKG